MIHGKPIFRSIGIDNSWEMVLAGVMVSAETMLTNANF